MGRTQIVRSFRQNVRRRSAASGDQAPTLVAKGRLVLPQPDRTSNPAGVPTGQGIRWMPLKFGRDATVRKSQKRKQGRRDLNPQPAVLETAALPIELHPCSDFDAGARSATPRRSLVRRAEKLRRRNEPTRRRSPGRSYCNRFPLAGATSISTLEKNVDGSRPPPDSSFCSDLQKLRVSSDQEMIFDTTPEPTVRPPSRMAKRTPSSMAIGLSSSTVTLTLSPGMHISAPVRLAVPVTSVVRK